MDIPFADALDKLKKALAERGFRIFAIIDHREAARSVGMEMNPASVILFGNPEKGTVIMRETPAVAIDLPSKILVSGNGKTTIYFSRMGYLKERHSLKGVDEIARNFDDKVIKILREIS
ncbi:MAG: DUF302 domain-containing protein [Thermoplasmatales archaeon]